MADLTLIVPIFQLAGHAVVSHYMDKRARKQFLGQMQDLMPVHIRNGFVRPLFQADSPGSVPVGWKTASGVGVDVFYQIYPDIQVAIDRLGCESDTLANAGLHQPVTLHFDSDARDPTVRQRVGSGWPAKLQDQVLQDPDCNPLRRQKSHSMAKSAIGHHCVGILAKSKKSPKFAGAVILRVLGLARACGIHELSVADFLEIMANASVYEQLARNYYAAVLGVNDVSHFGYRLSGGDVVGNLTLGGGVEDDGVVQVGTMAQEHPVLTYPRPVEQLQNTKIKLAWGTKIENGEPIFMATGLAMALSCRPSDQRKRNFAKELAIEFAQGFIPSGLLKHNSSTAHILTAKRDVHGNPFYRPRESDHVKLKVYRSSDDQRLYATISEIGDWNWHWSPTGLFGKPCGCDRPDPMKHITNRQFEGIPITDVAIHTASKQNVTPIMHDQLQLHWVTGDLPLMISKTCRLLINTYVQAPGECLHCAICSATAHGCAVIIAGGA